jgi:DNA invertase Pin-like site-specific DNA recombinase
MPGIVEADNLDISPGRGELAELLYALSGWVARMESQRRSERTKAGLARIKAQRKCLGRPPGSKDKRKRRRRPRFTAL